MPDQLAKLILLLAVLTMIEIVGCGKSGDPPNGDTHTIAPDTASESAPIAVPSITLMDAAVAGNVEAVRHHITVGTDLNERQPESGSTALIAAATFGQVDTAKLLIEGGADLEAKNNEGSTALHTAAFLCRVEIVRALLAKGADRNARNNAGSTALDSVSGPFEGVKSVYDILQAVLGPYGLELDFEFIKETRPWIAALLRSG